MTDKIYLNGSTIRLKCVFKNFDGTMIDPDSVKLTIYNSKYVIISENVLTIANKNESGEYFFDFTTPNKVEGGQFTYFYEWYGDISGKVAVFRGTIRTKFI